MVPATHAVRSPWPTYPANPGSWPDPPPPIREILSADDVREAGCRYTILLGSSKRREGLVNVRERSDVRTAWVGSSRKCFAVEYSVSR